MTKGFYKGIPIEKMSRKELIEAVEQLGILYANLLKKYVDTP